MADDLELKSNADDAQRYWLEEGYDPGGVVREVDYAKNDVVDIPNANGVQGFGRH